MIKWLAKKAYAKGYAEGQRSGYLTGYWEARDNMAVRQKAMEMALRDAPRRGREDITCLADEFREYLKTDSPRE